MGSSSATARSCSVGQSHLIYAFIGMAFSDNESNVVLLFVRTETTHFVDHCRNQEVGRKVSMKPKTIQQALLTELFAVRTARLGDTVCVKCQSVSHEETRPPGGTRRRSL